MEVPAEVLKCQWAEQKGSLASARFRKPSEKIKLHLLTRYFIFLPLQFLFDEPVKHYEILLIKEQRENQLSSCAGLVKQGKSPVHQSTALLNVKHNQVTVDSKYAYSPVK